MKRRSSSDWVISGALFLVASSVAQAQSSPSSGAGATSAVTICQLGDVAPDKAPSGGAGLLFAACGGHGAPLGPADHYSDATDPVTGSLLIVTTTAARTRVWLVSSAAAGTSVLVEELTRELARLGGRAGNLGLGSLGVDLSRFAVTGEVGVTGAGGTKLLGLRGNAARAAAIAPAAASAATVPAANQ